MVSIGIRRLRPFVPALGALALTVACGGDGVRSTGPDPGPAAVSLSTPARATLGEAVVVDAAARGSDGSVIRVDVFDGKTLVGTDSSAPYSVRWTPTGTGTHSLTARATYAGGAQTTSAAVSVEVMAAQYLVITIDTEALPHRQSQDHVQRLIYGNFPGQGRAGIVEMMDAADRHHVKLTFFLDLLEEWLYPGEIEAVAKLIVQRGHDLQPHCHVSDMPDAFYTRSGLPRTDTSTYTEAQGLLLLDELAQITRGWGVPPFTAWRLGGYRYSPGLVQAMPQRGIRTSYNYDIHGPSQRHLLPPNVPAFRWENDLLEVPVSYIDGTPPVDGGVAEPIRFDDIPYERSGDPRTSYRLIDAFEHQWPSSNVLVMMLHSWSLLYPVLDGATGLTYFAYQDDRKTTLFERFLAGLPPQVKVVSARELVMRTRRDAYAWRADAGGVHWAPTASRRESRIECRIRFEPPFDAPHYSRLWDEARADQAPRRVRD